MKDAVGKLKNRCMQQLDENSWYNYRFITKVMDCDGFNFDQTVNTLKMVAEIEPVKEKRMIKIIMFKELASVVTAKPEVLNIQYAKCIRALIENNGSNTFTYEDLVQLYLGNPLSYYFVKDDLDLNICITDCLNGQIFGDMQHINKTNKNFAIKKYIVKDLESSKVREANAKEEEKIYSIFWKYVRMSNRYLPITKQGRAIEAINAEFDNLEFVTTAFEIGYADEFRHRELYTPEVIRNEILKKWSFSIFRRHGRKPDYIAWHEKFIEPNLIGDKKGA